MIIKNKEGALVCLDTDDGGTIKLHDYSGGQYKDSEKTLFYQNVNGALVLFDKNDSTTTVLDDYNGGLYKNFNQNLCYQNQEGGLVFFDMRYNGTFTFTFNDYGGGNDLEIHMIDQVLLYPNSKGELVVCDTDTGSVEVFNDGNYYQSSDGTLYSISKNRLCTVTRQHRDTQGSEK
ncbi:hypothetical protein [Endozoicomonas atrinae]|uniref:hypothetical protein n=1 Tax=Endozoicomonas atrinae TaxID=1333660 RepID=UPI003B0099ED